MKMFKSESITYGFTATFSAPDDYIGWDPITYSFGSTDEVSALEELNVNS